MTHPQCRIADGDLKKKLGETGSESRGAVRDKGDSINRTDRDDTKSNQNDQDKKKEWLKAVVLNLWSVDH